MHVLGVDDSAVIATGEGEQAPEKNGDREAEKLSQTTYCSSLWRIHRSGLDIGGYVGLRCNGFGLTESP